MMKTTRFLAGLPSFSATEVRKRAEQPRADATRQPLLVLSAKDVKLDVVNSSSIRTRVHGVGLSIGNFSPHLAPIIDLLDDSHDSTLLFGSASPGNIAELFAVRRDHVKPGGVFRNVGVLSEIKYGARLQGPTLNLGGIGLEHEIVVLALLGPKVPIADRLDTDEILFVT
ncbi:hypothetical protein [Ellagibacter isourolithinifaciens]|uniref:hypothetical protein n=1 Tax=Ellagibacter isourolithinifaciens TaxID=2137581 RepID=UPI002E79023D|nr:hypothetical protein [Ellagibacter isourolithinifaciens]